MKRILMVFLAALFVMLAGCTGQSEDTTVPSNNSQISPSESEGNMKKEAFLEFDSFDGGGPDFTAFWEDESLVSVQRSVEYNDPEHGEKKGSAFTVRFTFTGRKQGETGLKIEERSPIAGNYDWTYKLTVSDDLQVSIEQLEKVDLDAPT